uniref:BED-type domain-containing protein n=1 Tax=Parascaris univalens TaxID=6257 RepID=A0A915BKR0_PARUN
MQTCLKQMNELNNGVHGTALLSGVADRDESLAGQHTEGELIDSVVDDAKVIKEEENYMGSSDDEKSDSQTDSLDSSHAPGDSTEPDVTIEPDAFVEELKGKNFTEQVKFLKEQGLTFRTISERLNVPITNCHTAIKKLGLPSEYWEKVKAEVRMRRKAKEITIGNASDGHRTFLSTAVHSRKRHQEELQQDFGRELELTPSPSKMPSLFNGVVGKQSSDRMPRFHVDHTAMNLAQTPAPFFSENMPLSGRKHLTLEDGKMVQYWRDKGLTLQKIAEKLQMPMSSCYRAMKRYQVSQKANLIMGAENGVTGDVTATTVVEPVLEDNRTLTKSTSELLLGMVNASMSNLPSTSNGNSSAAQPERTASAHSSVQNSETTVQEFLSEERRRKPKQSVSWAFIMPTNRPNIYQCIICGLEMQSPNAWNISQHLKMRHPEKFQEAKNTEIQKKMKSGKDDAEVSSNACLASHSRTSSDSHCSVPLSQETNHVLQTIKEKLEWAAAKMTSSTDAEEIITLMKVMSSGLTLLKQFAPQH